MHLSSELVKLLNDQGTSVEDYKPAYNGESVGLDLYNTGETVYLPPEGGLYFQGHEPQLSPVRAGRTLIPTGIRVALPLNTVALLRERGSITKTPLVLRAGVIDPGYTGEIFVNLINCAATEFTIAHGDKLPVQLLVMPALTNFTPVDNNTYHKITSTSRRADGKIGSSD